MRAHEDPLLRACAAALGAAPRTVTATLRRAHPRLDGVVEPGDALALEAAGCFAVVMEMVPSPVAQRVTEALRIPTVGIGAGPQCDGQVLVWQDMAGLRGGRAPRFVKKYANLRETLGDAARAYAADVSSGAFPAAEQSFES